VVEIDLSAQGNEAEVALSVGEVTVLVWLLDLAAEEGTLEGEASEIWRRTRDRLTERTAAVTGA
jgi:hypothetical protein